MRCQVYPNIVNCHVCARMAERREEDELAAWTPFDDHPRRYYVGYTLQDLLLRPVSSRYEPQPLPVVDRVGQRANDPCRCQCTRGGVCGGCGHRTCAQR